MSGKCWTEEAFKSQDTQSTHKNVLCSLLLLQNNVPNIFQFKVQNQKQVLRPHT